MKGIRYFNEMQVLAKVGEFDHAYQYLLTKKRQ